MAPKSKIINNYAYSYNESHKTSQEFRYIKVTIANIQLQARTSKVIINIRTCYSIITFT